MNVGINIKNLRKQKGLSQAKLAALVDVDRSAIAQWENGISYPRMNHLNRVAEVFETTPSALIGTTPLMPAYVPIIASDGTLTPETLEIPATLLERHPRAAAYVMPDDTMANLIPQGLAAIYDPDLAPASGAPAVVRADGRVIVRRLYRGSTTLMLSTDSHEPHDDVLIREPSPACVLGAVVWVQSAAELG